MATESSSVFVAVRVRPFSPREDTACCTVTIPDATTISVLDVPTLIPSSTSGGPAAGGQQHGSTSGTSAGVDFISSVNGSSASAVPHGMVGGSSNAGTGKNLNYIAPGALDPLRHSYSFDRIFWSVAPTVLPFPPLSVLEALQHGDDSVGSGKLGTLRLPGLVQPTPTQRTLLAQYSNVAKHLPCFAAAPTYDDQQRVYDFIGPRMHDAVMSGFNACLFAYGQTGSGKSYSMIGPTEALTAAVVNAKAAANAVAVSSSGAVKAGGDGGAERGIMPRLFTDLFRRMREEREKDESVTFTVEVSFLEVYCEKVRDLLAGAGSATGADGATAAITSNSVTAGSSLRIRQHPSQGPYVEGLTHIKVRDEAGALRHLLAGLRDRATAGTNMNEHSSRSHAILQLQVTKVVADTDSSTGAVVTRTCVSKATMVDLAGSERVSQSGVSGERFEEAKNINLSLSTLGRVIQQLSEKQSGRHVIPAYRDSVLTWLLSDSLGGNSKTIMLATVAPSAYCYQQTLNTLRFAGVAKKVVNVASVNEDRHFQQLIAELRQQIVRLTLQLESGKAAEVHLEKIDALKGQREVLQRENDVLKAKALAAAADTAVLQALRQRVAELESENAQLRDDGQALQERLLTSTTTLRAELAQQQAEVLRLQASVLKKEAEVRDWTNRYRALVLTTTSPAVMTTNAPVGVGGKGVAAAASTAATSAAATGSTASVAGSRSRDPSSAGVPQHHHHYHTNATKTATVPATAATVMATTVNHNTTTASNATEQDTTKEAQHKRLEEELTQLKAKLQKSRQENAEAQRARQEVADAHKATSTALDEYKVRYEESTRQLSLLHERMQSTASLLETTQCELTALKSRGSSHASAQSRAVEDALEATSAAHSTAAAAQLAQARTDYLEEKQRNVDLLLRVAQVEQERSTLKRALAERAADTCELEQLLLEETESAERYYLRMRYHRYTNELLQRFVVQLQHLQNMAGGRVQRGSVLSAGPSSTLSGPFSNNSRKMHFFGDGESDGGDVETNDVSTAASHRASAAVDAATNTTRLLFNQLLFACQSEEAQGRLGIELACAQEAGRVLLQRGRQQQLTTAALREKVGEVDDAARALRAEVHFYKAKASAAVAEGEAAASRQQADAAALQVAEVDRLRLERKAAALEDVRAELESGRDALIAKVALQQEELRSWQARCTEAERVAAELQDLLLPATTTTTTNTSLPDKIECGISFAKAGTESSRGTAETAEQEQRQDAAPAAVQLDRAALASRARAAQDVLDAKEGVLQQCETYRTELGVVRAQLEQAKSERQDATAQLARHEQSVQLAEARHAEANAQLLHEIGTITRDYESRIKQQQTMMRTLRHALDEETAMADLCRQSAQRAEAARHAQEEDLIAAREACEEQRRQAESFAHRYDGVQADLDQLRAHYNALERRLVALQQSEPELYLLLEKNRDEEGDGTHWLGKVHSERLRLQKQRSEAQRLNTELLEHVRDGTTRLRDVQKQLTDVSFGEDSGTAYSAAAKTSPSEDEEELTRTARKGADRRFSQLS